MRRLWSISTTVRNPYRIRDFLKILKYMEGDPWTRPNQRRFQILLIQYKVYGYGSSQFLNALEPKHRLLMDTPDPISFEEAESILEAQNYVGGGEMRGRQSFNPLEKMGLAEIDEDNQVRITSFGRYFLEDDFDLGDIFLRSLVKWQLPNPDARNYSASDGYDIKPFVATLRVVKHVNELWQAKGHEPVGLSFREFGIFLPLMINANQIEETAADIVSFREARATAGENRRIFSEEFRLMRARKFLGDEASHEQVEAVVANMREYADNIIRYFRLSRLFRIRGDGYYIDLEPLRNTEIAAILAMDNARATTFSDLLAYRAYMNEYTPTLPWESAAEIRQSIKTTEEALDSFSDILSGRGISFPPFNKKNIDGVDQRVAKSYLEELRSHRRVLQEAELLQVAQDPVRMREYINALSSIRAGSGGLELERLAVRALNAIDDAIAIKPNYPVGDDGEPTFTAPGGRADIECFYGEFNATCEVTLLRSRDQWFNEGQPVMRHLREFEVAHAPTPAYCIFIAPGIHTDTAETYWTSIKHGYRGGKQNIVPLTINQLVSILEFVLNRRVQGHRFSRQQMRQLFDAVIFKTAQVESSDEWVDGIQNVIEQWKETVTVTAE